jgi:polar amino acid transport system substrate-binding protein
MATVEAPPIDTVARGDRVSENAARCQPGEGREGKQMSVQNCLVLTLSTAMMAGLMGDGLHNAAQPAPADRQALAPTGRLRVGVYPGSPTSMIRDESSGEAKGLTFDLGKEFARRLNVPFKPVEFRQIADVLDAMKQGRVDFTVTNASPARAQLIDFTAPILGVELGYLVPPRSSISTFADIDRPGIRVGVTEGGSSHSTLSRELKHATVVPSPSLKIAVEMLASGRVDAYATNKAILFEMSDQSPGSRVLDGRWGIEVFAIGIPKGRDLALPTVRKFAEDAQSEGLVKRAAERAGLRGTTDVK